MKKNLPTCKSSLSVCLSFSRYSSKPSLVNSYCKWTLKFISSTEWTTIFTNCIQATMNSMWKLSYWVKYAISVVNRRLSEQTSLKLSNAERIISWPPFTKQIAARSSKTRAFVLKTKFQFFPILQRNLINTIYILNWGRGEKIFLPQTLVHQTERDAVDCFTMLNDHVETIL